MEINRTSGTAGERAFLVSVLLDEQGSYQADPLEELADLTESAGATVVGRLTQRRQTPDKTTYLGSGKVGELKLQAEAEDADVVVFDNNLSPAQIRNLEKVLGIKVLDRTELILDIFAGRAKTHEARLAVELAQLEYSLPRLKRMWTHLSRIKMGIGMRGPGEKQLEVDKRLAEKKIYDLRMELAGIERRKERQVATRSDRKTVSLCGYTNAGKSTLMNRLTGSDEYAKDQLFATLDTRTRRWQLPGWGPVLLSDTVGFIRDLPHQLVAGFKATLEETRQADLLLHVADASNPHAQEQISAVYKVLEELGIHAKDTLLVLNKVDAVQDRGTLDRLLGLYPNAVPVSARSGLGIPQLARAVSDALSRNFRDVEVETSVANGKLMAYLSAHGEVLSRQFHDERVVIHCRLAQEHLGPLEGETGVTIRPYKVGDHAAPEASALDAALNPHAAAVDGVNLAETA
ncbi:MAG: GTPase HflX [Pirellula sp.]|nr:GTPase HflX [Pirellula sp.]